MGIGFTLKTLKALNSFDINCFVLKVSKHWVSVLSYNYVWPRGPALFATLGVPNAAGSPETCRRASSHACYSTVTPICSVADLSRSNPNKPVFQDLSCILPRTQTVSQIKSLNLKSSGQPCFPNCPKMTQSETWCKMTVKKMQIKHKIIHLKLLLS